MKSDKNKKKSAYLWKNSFDTLVWETIKITNLNTDSYFHKCYFVSINQWTIFSI